MIRRAVAAAVAVALTVVGCGRGSGPEHDVLAALREVDGVKRASNVPWLIRAGDHIFSVRLEKNPTPDTLSEVLKAYGRTAPALRSTDIALYVRWKAGDQDREISGWGVTMPDDAYVRAAADWPTDVQMRAGFYSAQGFVVSVRTDDDQFAGLLHRIAGLNLQGDDVGVYSPRYKVSWADTPPVARFDAAVAAAPSITELKVRQATFEGEVDKTSARWDAPASDVRPEIEALVDLWAAAPTREGLGIRTSDGQWADLDNKVCPDPAEPLAVELWAYAQRPGHRIVAAPDC
ncbi:MAG: hypothetical protein Q4G46_00385 [Propionibacteriaceae bacterium]|nr:hypothetical protein [Propionibacteriaceae bacterium]